MGLLGAILGGTVGLMLGGPLGAVLGGAIGSQVLADPRPEQIGGRARQARQARREQRPPPYPPYPPYPPPGQAAQDDPRVLQSTFMVALISLAARVAKADGRVSSAEIAAFDAFLSRELGMPAQERRLAARIFNQARDSELPTAAFTRQIRLALAAQPDRLRDLVALLLKIAYADGALAGEEETLIRAVALELGLGESDFRQIKAMFESSDLGAAYALLGVTPEASDEEIKRGYRRLAKEYHPDMLAAKGLPEDFMKFATEKLQAINQAYDRVRKQRGF